MTADLPGIGGVIKSEPGHFVVEEMPVYEPCGQGDHVFVRLTREGWATRELVLRLADIFSLPEVEIGCAGQKDKPARATQTFSLLLPRVREAEVTDRILKALPVEVAWVKRHNNKIKTGHLLGNRFSIILENPLPDSLERAESIRAALKTRGLPNFFGGQRFGAKGENVGLGRRILEGKRSGPHWRKRFLLSAYQAHLFNAWLTERFQRGWFERVIKGDIAKKLQTGGLFEVQEAPEEQLRFEAREITYTGPIYGRKMMPAGGEAGMLEQSILDDFEVSAKMLKEARLDGARRPACLFPSDLTIESKAEDLIFRFS